MKIEGTCAIITGGAQGIGEAVARVLVSKGGKVVIGDINEVKGLKLVEEFNRAGNIAHYVKCDVSKLEDLKNLFNEAVNKFGSFQIVFNNAGRSEHRDIYENPDSITNFINIMLTSVFQGCILANNHFQEQLKQDPSKQFCIINTSSVAGLELMKNCPIYSLCKKAVFDATRVLSLLNWKNVRINGIGPLFTRTNILNVNGHDLTERFTARHGMMEPEYIAGKMIELVEDNGLNGVVRFVYSNKIFDAEPLKLVKF